MSKEVNDIETEDMLNDIANLYTNAFITTMYNDGISEELAYDTIQNYLANPDNYIIALENLANYLYISNGEVHQLFDIVKCLPTLNYKIETFDETNYRDKRLKDCNKALHKVRYKKLTRDLLTQEISVGTVVGMWLGDKKNPYLYLFDNFDLVFPYYLKNGEWQLVFNLKTFSGFSENVKEKYLQTFGKYITKKELDKFEENQEYYLIELPQERTICLRTGVLKRNQRYGVNWATTGLFDIFHKNKLKNLEKSIANKIINSIAILTIGNKDDPKEFGNIKLGKTLKQKIYSNVKAALEKNQTSGVTVIGIPEYTELAFGEIKNGDTALNPKKYESINFDLAADYGISQVLTTGSGGNYASAKLNLDIIYKRIGVLLEDIEEQVFNKLFNLILPASCQDDYWMTFDKETPLTLKDKLDKLMELHKQEGFALKPVIDLIDGIDWDSYIKQSLYEQENMKLPSKIKPYASAYIGGDNNSVGAPSIEDPTNPSTITDKTNDGNSLPE